MLDHTHELRMLRHEIEHLLRGRSLGSRFSSTDETRYQFLAAREIQLLRAIRAGGPMFPGAPSRCR